MKKQEQKTSIILVEDDDVLRESLSEYLTLKGFLVTGVCNGLEFFERLSEQHFALAIIDLGLPDQSGQVLVDHARNNSSMSLIVITANDTVTARIGSYQSGADLFMGKPVNGRELVAAINSLVQRQSLREVKNEDSWLLDGKNWLLVSPEKQKIHCTLKEFRLLELLVDMASEPVKRTTILGALYERDDQSSQRALDTLVKRVRQKIAAVYDGDTPIRTAYSVGYIFSAPVVCLKDQSLP